MTEHIAVCHVHDLSWNIDRDPPHYCDHEHDLLVFYDCKICQDTGRTYDQTEKRMVPCGRVECKVRA